MPGAQFGCCTQGNIVAELIWVDNEALVKLVGSKHVYTVVSRDIIGVPIQLPTTLGCALNLSMAPLPCLGM